METINISPKTELESWEKEVLQETFEGFGVIVQVDTPLFGVDALTIIELVIIPLATSALYDLLKSGIQKLLKSYKQKDEKEIRIIVRKQERKIVIEANKITALINETTTTFDNLSDSINFLKIDE
jgi:hypothetical protein